MHTLAHPRHRIDAFLGSLLAVSMALGACEDPGPQPGDDADPPVVDITEPADGTEIGCTTVTVRGTAEDPSGVTEVAINGVSATATSAGFATWEATVELAAGASELSASATDGAGNTGSSLDTAAITVVDASALQIDLATGRLYGTLTLDGTDVFDPDLAYYVSLRDPETGQRAEVGYYATTANWQLYGIQGRYDVLVEPDAGLVADASVLVEPVVAARGIDLGAETRQDLELQRATLLGSVTVDGAPLASSGGAGYALGLVEPGAPPYHFLSWPGSEPQYTIRTLASTWDVWFKFQYGFFSPDSPEMLVLAAPSHELPGGESTLDLALTTAQVTGTLSVNGGPLDGGQVFFVNTSTLASYAWTVSGTSYAATVPAGNYDVSLVTAESVLGGDFYSEYHPVGTVNLGRGVDLAGAETLDVDVSTHTVSGTVTLDGAAPTSGGKSWYTIRLDDPVTGNAVSADYRIGSNTFSLTAFDGEYDVRVTLPAQAMDPDLHEWILPTWATTATVGAGAPPLDVAVQSGTVSGTVRLDGAALSASPGHWWRLEGVDAGGAVAVSSFDASEGTFDLYASPGTYDVRVVFDEFLLNGDDGALVLPRPIGSWNIAAGEQDSDVDVSSALIGGTLLLDGVPLDSSPGYTYGIGITDPALDADPAHRVELGFPASEPDFTAPTLVGTYDLWVLLPEDVLPGGAAIVPHRARQGLILCGP